MMNGGSCTSVRHVWPGIHEQQGCVARACVSIHRNCSPSRHEGACESGMRGKHCTATFGFGDSGISPPQKKIHRDRAWPYGTLAMIV